jgi:hypothetical protein
MTLEYQNPAARVPLSERINFRLVTFIALVAMIVGYPVYVLIDTQVSGGIKHAGDYLDVNLKAMSTFTFDQANGTNNDIPPRWRELDGKKVILKGEMWETTGAGDEVGRFVLVYSIAKCCVQGTPLVQHLVISQPMRGKRLSYYDGQVECRGVLHVKVNKDAERVVSIYEFDVESIHPVQ